MLETEVCKKGSTVADIRHTFGVGPRTVAARETIALLAATAFDLQSAVVTTGAVISAPAMLSAGTLAWDAYAWMIAGEFLGIQGVASLLACVLQCELS